MESSLESLDSNINLLSLTARHLILMVKSGLSVKILSDRVVIAPQRASGAASRQKRYRERRKMSESDWKKMREEVLHRDGHTCVYCGSSGGGSPLHCDHVIPISKGGGNEIENLATACHACNTSKCDMTPEEWMVAA